MRSTRAIALLLLAGVFNNTVYAQQYEVKYDYINRIPNIRWLDKEHYVTYRPVPGQQGAQEVKISVRTNREEVIKRTAPKISNVTIVRKSELHIAKTQELQAIVLRGLDNPTFSPDSSHVAYTKKGNLYTYDIKQRKEQQITHDGTEAIYNGWSSWIYNEEILGRSMAYRAFWWSPDSKKLAFMRFDDRQVPIHYMTIDTAAHAEQVLVRYPLPGDPNPKVRIGIWQIGSSTLTWAKYEEERDQYFGQPYWTPESDELWVQWMNRGQDTLKIERIDLQDGSRNSVYTETQKTWVSLDQEERIRFVPSKNLFLVMSDRDGWMHLYAYDRTGKLITQLTKGNWSVQEIQHVDAQSGTVFFTANKESSTRSDLYKVGLKGEQLKRLTFGEYTHRTQLSEDGRYFITNYSNYKTPEKAALLDQQGKIIRELADSKGKDFDLINPKAGKYDMIRVKTTDGFDLPVRIHYPANFDPAKKYGVIAHIYGGPNSVMVRDGFFGGIGDPLADTTHLISVQMDHRGSGHFGKVGQDYMHRNLGHWEILDYSTVIEYLKANYDFIDAEKIGISGFSYGGYISAMALLKAPDIFKAALAGGSVTDWRFYDSAYTERFMDSPAENPEGYKTSSVLNYVKNLKGHLSLAQGTADDNVHMRNTMRLIDALQEQQKEFEVMFYPGAAHGWFYLRNKAAHYNKANRDFIKKYLID